MKALSKALSEKSQFLSPIRMTSLPFLPRKERTFSSKSKDLTGPLGGLYQPGAGPERNLTRAQPKSRGCRYMGVALSMGSYKHDLADAAQSSA